MNCRGSRFAEPYARKIGAPFGMVVPAMSMSSTAERVGQNCTDDSKRSNSSTPDTISSGRWRSFSSASGCRSRVSTLWAMRLTVVSCPAKIRSRALLVSRPLGIRPSGPSSFTIAESMPGPGCRAYRSYNSAVNRPNSCTA